MSLWTKIRNKVIRPLVGGAVSAVPFVGPALSTAITTPTPRTFAPEGFGGGGAMPVNLPPLPAIVAGGTAVARMGVAGARTIMNSAISLCRRNPQWCAGIGGTAAVAAMIQQGQLPTVRRRRGRGLSARDIRGFKRTHRLVRQVMATTPGVARRGRSGRAPGSGTIIAQN